MNPINWLQQQIQNAATGNKTAGWATSQGTPTKSTQGFTSGFKSGSVGGGGGGGGGTAYVPPTYTGPVSAPSGGGGGGSSQQSMSVSAPSGDTGGQDVNALNEQIRNEISGAYDQYFAGLDQQLGTIGDQRTQQEGIVQSQLNQGLNTLGSQKEQGMKDLGGERVKNTENQVKTLQDLADNIRNQFQAGRLNLGARGAGDSSAANQYSYAIAKMGNKARGDVLGQTRSIENEIANREFKLKNIYDTETRNLQETTNQKILEVANWFSQAQQQIQQMKAQGQLAKGQDLATLSKQALQTAQNQLLMAQQEAANKRTALDQWAMNNATNINQLKTNMAGTSTYAAPGVVRPEISGQITTDASGAMSGPTYRNPYGFSTTGTNEDTTKKYPWLSNQTGVMWGV